MTNPIVRAWRRAWLCNVRWAARHPGRYICLRHRWHPGDCQGLIVGTWERGADGYRCWIPSAEPEEGFNPGPVDNLVASDWTSFESEMATWVRDNDRENNG